MRRLLLAALIAGCGVLLQPMPAEAGGPTSVLVTNQSLGRATGFTISDARYGELEQLMADATPVTEPATFPNGDWLVMTWLLHDVRVWQTHQVLLDAEGGPLVATTSPDLEGATTSTAEQTWSRIDDGPALTALLTKIGMIGNGKPQNPAAGQPVTDQPPAGAAVQTTAEPESRWFALTGWRWAVPGLLAGMMLGLAFLPARRLLTRRSGPPVERHQLIDLPGH